MSLYNLLHGVDPRAPLYLQALSIAPESISRFRDCHLSGDGTRFLLLTRTGGGNRKDYAEFFRQIRLHPNYIRDYDDDYDSTFCYVEFHVPEHALAIFKPLATGEDPPTLQQKFERVTEEMEKMTPEQLETDPRTKDITAMFKQVFEKLKKNQ